MIELDIFSDTVCPWCYIGKKRLEKAINNYKDTEIKQTWRPFQLNPGMPPDGMDRQEYLISKFFFYPAITCRYFLPNSIRHPTGGGCFRS